MAWMAVPSSVTRTTPRKYTTAPMLSAICRCASKAVSSIGSALISSFLFIPHSALPIRLPVFPILHYALHTLHFISSSLDWRKERHVIALFETILPVLIVESNRHQDGFADWPQLWKLCDQPLEEGVEGALVRQCLRDLGATRQVFQIRIKIYVHLHGQISLSFPVGRGGPSVQVRVQHADKGQI